MLCLGQFHDNRVSKNYASWFKGAYNDFQQKEMFGYFFVDCASLGCL